MQPRPLNRLPGATYRLQFNRQFTFAQARDVISYLSDLGISDVYASPLFLAGPESTHGYDVCSFDRLNPNLGEPEDFQAFTREIRDHALGLLLDMVPNHMGNSVRNIWWRDVLRRGPTSPYAAFFDVDWDARPDHKVLLPLLGDRYGEVLQRGELRLELNDGELCLAYFDKTFPLSPETEHKLDYNSGDPAAIHAAKQALENINQDHARLHQIIQAQHYRLAFWRIGPHEINYRRFFDVTELVSLRVEDPQVFVSTHHFVFELISQGEVTGLRIDHPDGLRDPKTYFDRLQNAFHRLDPERDLFIEAEKILSHDERLPEDWPICGTTGYDYLNYLNGIFIANANEDQFSRIYREFTGNTTEYRQVEYEARKFVLNRLFPKEVQSLTLRWRRLADETVEGIDFTTPELESALVEYIAAFPVYRTYAREGLNRLTRSEQGYIGEAVRRASERAPQCAPVLQLLERLLRLESARDAKIGRESQEFVARLQQLTGPATAKGLEDTAFYRYVRFVSLNEVGGNPGHFGLSLETFHEYNQHKAQRWPHSQLATSTHDTKRGEDLRARLNVLSEIPHEWQEHLAYWADVNRPFKNDAGAKLSPNANDEYLLYQILLGSWTGPGDLDHYIPRIQQYMQKATREAKEHTSWTDPDESYENATHNFVASVLRSASFRARFEPLARRLAFFGVFNSLAQVLLKVCSPGLPDFYQGTELWDFNLVDPDNRRPVDYQHRKEALARVQKIDHRTLLENPENGEIKLFVTRAVLQFRRAHRELFENGAYIPISVRGSQREHVVAFAREHGPKRVIVVAPRLPLTLVHGERKPPIGPEVWGDTELELERGHGPYRNEFTGKPSTGARLSEFFSEFPLALLESL